jgi:hypothetical protein
MSDIKVLKLMSGEEIVAEVTDKGEVYTLKEPVTIVYQPVEGGGMNAGFAPFMPYSSGILTLNKNSIASYADVDAKLLAEYNRIFSKIEIVPAGKIIT